MNAEAQLVGERLQLEEYARRAYPEEACAVVLVRGGRAIRLLLPCQNDAPKAERRARYALGGYDLGRIGTYLLQGWAIDTIFHSHCDTPPTFSQRDHEAAVAGGVPLYPDAIYKIVEIRHGTPAGWAAYRFEPKSGRFVETPAWP